MDIAAFLRRPEAPDLAWIAPGALLFILPFAHTAPARLGLLIATVLLALANLRHRRVPALPCRFPLLAWAAFALASLAWSIDAYYSTRELRNEVLYPLCAFAGFFSLTTGLDRWRCWGRVIVAGGLVVSLYALLAFSHNGEWAPEWAGDANAYSTYVVLLMPMLLLAATRVGSEIAPGWQVGATLVLALVCGHLTLNRMMWPTLALMLLVFLALYLRKAKATARIRSLGIIVFIGVCAAFGSMYLVAHQSKGGTASAVSTELLIDLQQDPRPQIWAYAAKRIAERPFTGYGYGRGILRLDFRAHFGDPLYWHAHNLFLNAALEMGLGGLLALLWLFASLTRECWRLYRDQPLPAAMVGAFGITLIVGGLLKSLTDDVLIRENSLLFWAQLGMTMGVARRLAANPNGASG